MRLLTDTTGLYQRGRHVHASVQSVNGGCAFVGLLRELHFMTCIASRALRVLCSAAACCVRAYVRILRVRAVRHDGLLLGL